MFFVCFKIFECTTRVLRRVVPKFLCGLHLTPHENSLVVLQEFVCVREKHFFNC